jgi:signal peptidase II
MEFKMTLFKKKSLIDYIVYSAIILGGIFIYQLTKFLSFKFLTKVDTIPIIEDVIHLTFETNRGMAFSMLSNNRWVFITISTVAILAFLAYLYLGHADNIYYGVALSMVISGGIGNMIDRFGLGFYVAPDGVGEVIDFIDFRLINFAIFNGADSFVCVGAGLLVLALVIDIVKEYKAEKGKGSEK